MKFVCDNCQAKYQIGDDKVAGKTVRMKCRKCGYNIKVSPGGGLETPSAEVPAHAVEAPPSIASAPTPGVTAAHAAPPSPAQPSWVGGDDDESTAIMSGRVRDAVAALSAGAPATTRAPLAGSAPRPSAHEGGGASKRPVAAHPPRPVSAGAAPRPLTTAPPRPVTSVAAPRPHDPGLTDVHAHAHAPAARSHTPAPAAAVARPVSRQPSMSVAAVHYDHPPHAASAPELEWYVGIHGSPIGPVHVSVIRERAAANEVDGESLVWHEGLPEWRPLRTFPELLDVIGAAPVARTVEMPAPFAPVAAPPAQARLAAVAAPPAPAPVVVAPPPAPATTAHDGGSAPKPPVPAAPVAPLQVVADPFAHAPSPFASGQGGVGPAPAPGQNGKANGFHIATGVDATVRAPAPAGAPLPATPNVEVAPAIDEALRSRRRGGLHPMAYAFIAAVTVFSGVSAYALFTKPAQIVVVQAPSTSGAAAPAASGESKDQQVEVGVGEISAVTPTGSAARQSVGGARPRVSAAPAAPVSPTVSAASPIDTSGFIANVPGPAATAASAPPSGGQLSQGEMNGVVAQNQPRVRRKCWQPALDGQSVNGTKNARVSVSITIGASGAVDSASASGAERDFPGLSSCIAGMVRAWKFPASGGSTQVTVPFVFAGQ